MTNLRTIQENFQAYVLEQEPTIEAAVVGDTQDFRLLRLDIYRDGYALRLLEALEQTYGVLRKLIGEEQFEAYGRAYIAQYPSHHFSIRMYSAHFSQFLQDQQVDAGWVDMARFEWAIGETLDAADAPHLTFAELSHVQPEAWASLTLSIHPSKQIQSFDYPVAQLWLAVHHKQPYPALEPAPQPVSWVIWRYQQRALFRELSHQQLWMIEAIESGKPFAEICEGLCQWMSEDQVVNFAAQTLRGWIEEGLFSGYEVKSD
ncbi:MAG: DNA-binding domain-containing protein [Gammaproteobacteria bacterium]